MGVCDLGVWNMKLHPKTEIGSDVLNPAEEVYEIRCISYARR